MFRKWMTLSRGPPNLFYFHDFRRRSLLFKIRNFCLNLRFSARISLKFFFLKHFSTFVPFKTIIKIDNFRCLKNQLLKLTTFGQHTIEKIFINNPKFWVEGSRKWFLRNSMIFGKKEFKNIHDLLSEDP